MDDDDDSSSGGSQQEGSPARVTRLRNKELDMDLCQEMVKFLEGLEVATRFLHPVSKREVRAAPSHAVLQLLPLETN